jgi:hypothetical protein
LKQNNPETADPNGGYLAVGSQRKEGVMETVSNIDENILKQY